MIVRSLFLFVALSLASSCEDRCNNGNLIDIVPPTPVEDFQVSDKSGVLWKITSPVPRQIEFLRYGEVPSGFQQIIPAGSARPRPFVTDETLYTKTITADRIYEHEGIAGSATSFCGGYYLTSPRAKS
jgi:hypothetical protein